MTVASPFTDRMLLHVSTQPRGHDPLLAAIAGGVVLQAPLRRAAARSLLRSSSVAVLQHGGHNDPTPALLHPDDVWILEQTEAAVVTSRTAILGDPASMSDTQLSAVVADLRGFSSRAANYGFPDTAASVVVDRRWLTTGSRRRTLISALRDVGAPIHLMLASESDPLESPQAVTGLVEVVQGVSNVAVVRCDHGALGAYAFGALGGSIGGTGGTRHFVMPGQRGFSVVDDPTPRVFVPSLMLWWRGSHLALSRDLLFDCDCPQCGGLNLSRFEDESLLADADTHSVTVLASLMDDLRRTESGAPREKRWIDSCEAAWRAVAELEDRSGLPQPVSKQLKSWLRFAGVQVY